MLLFLYSIGNLHNVSWGTRETKTDNPEPDKAKQQQKKTPEKEETGHFSLLWYVEVSLLIKNKSDVTITSWLYLGLFLIYSKYLKLLTIENTVLIFQFYKYIIVILKFIEL
jgi:hypothetical protein